MMFRILFISATLFLLQLHEVMAQSCTYNFANDYEQMTRLSNESQATANGIDSVTVPVMSTHATDLFETWYVPRYTGSCPTGTSSLLRVYKSASLDHADTPVLGDPTGYSLDTTLNAAGTLGCPWNSASRQGLVPIRRYLKTSPVDYLTLLDSAPTGFSLDETWSSGTSTRLGYQRFGNQLTDFSSAYDGTYRLSNGVLTVDFNKLWGNAIGQITQVASGTQIVKNPGPGFLVQSIAWFDPGSGCGVGNPTQAGGTACSGTRDPSLWQGSPVISTSRVGTDPAQPQTLTSTIRPFDFCSQWSSGTWPNSDPASPLAWRGFIRRADTLSCNLNGAVRKDVLKSTSQLMLGEGSTAASQSSGGQWNTYWLFEPGDATQGQVTIEWVDLDTNTTTNIPIAYQSSPPSFRLNNQTCPGTTTPCTDYTVPQNGHAQALIVSSSSISYALVTLDPTIALNISYRCSAAPCSSANVVVVLNGQGSSTWSTASWSTPMTNYLIVNNLTAIMTRLTELHNYGGGC